MFNRDLIPINSHPNNDRCRLITEVTMVSPRLSGMHITYVQFDKWDTDPGKHIADRNGGMCIGTRIYDDAVDVTPRSLDAVHDGAFMVGLESFEMSAERRCLGLTGLFDVGERSRTVNVRFAGSQEI